MSDDTDASRPPIPTRWPELIVACVLLVGSILVITDSLRVGRDWASDGPKAGYFPFFIGIGLAVVSLGIAFQQLRTWRSDQRVFSERHEIAGVIAILWPMVVYVAAMKWLGLYVTSIVLITYFMRRHGKYGWGLSAGVSVGVMAVLYAVFERWFLVPLPKGPVEAMLGL